MFFKMSRCALHNFFHINVQYNTSVLYSWVISAFGKVVWISQVVLPVVFAILIKTVINTLIELLFHQNTSWMFVLTYIEHKTKFFPENTLHKSTDIKLYHRCIYRMQMFCFSETNWCHAYFSGFGVWGTFDDHIEIKVIHINVSSICCQGWFCYLAYFLLFLLILFLFDSFFSLLAFLLLLDFLLFFFLSFFSPFQCTTFYSTSF